MISDEIQHWIRVKLQNIQEYYEKYGLGKSILHAFERILNYTGMTFEKKSLIFFERKLKEEILLPENDNGVHLVKIEKEDIEKLDTYHDGWFRKEDALKRLEENRILFAVKEQNQLAFFQWIEFEKVDIPFIELSFAIPAKTVCMAYIYTVPEYRGRGIASKAKLPVLKYLQELGYCKVLLMIEPDNLASQKVNKRVGFREYQTVNFWKILFRTSNFLKFYSVTDYETNQRKIFWHRNENKHELWRIFSKIEDQEE